MNRMFGRSSAEAAMANEQKAAKAAKRARRARGIVIPSQMGEGSKGISVMSRGAAINRHAAACRMQQRQSRTDRIWSGCLAREQRLQSRQREAALGEECCPIGSRVASRCWDRL